MSHYAAVQPQFPPKAPQACSSCRRHKRRCDKELPGCGLCTRLGRPCQYTDVLPPPTAEGMAALWDRVAELENRTNPMNQAPVDSLPPLPMQHVPGPIVHFTSAPKSEVAGIFLDWDAFTWLGTSVPKPNIDLPDEVLMFVSNSDSVQQICDRYFSTTHTWMPIISKKRMNLGYQLWEGGPDLALLFLTMKLISSPLSDGEIASANHLYGISKRFLSLLEVSGCVSLIHLQGMFLVALYEFSHGIYPAAWMSVAACVRYAEMLGLPNHGDSKYLLGQSTTRTGVEEKKRIWWAVFVLDRVICLGNKRRFLMPHPSARETLPVDDAGWDEGSVMTPSGPEVSEPFSVQSAPFPRLCQVAVIIGYALEHWTAADSARRLGHELPLSEMESQVETLNEARKVLAADIGSSQMELSPLLIPYCLIESAIVLIQDLYSCPVHIKYGQDRPLSREESKLQIIAVQELRGVSLRLTDIARKVLSHTQSGEDLALLNPMICDSMYCAGATMDWLYHESGEAEAEESLGVMKSFLSTFAVRWRLGSEYSKVLDQHDIAVRLNVERL